MRQHTVLGLLGTVLLCCLSVLAAPSEASEERVVQWDDLLSDAARENDPLLNLSPAQISDLEAVLNADIAWLERRDDPAVVAAAKAARGRLSAAGLDADELLDQHFFGMDDSAFDATGVATDLLGQDVTIYGYVLPLRWERERVVAFFLVPWVGACIHTPPPPPNQIVYVEMPEGLALKQQFEPMSIRGTLRHNLQSYDLFLIDGRQQVPAAYQLMAAEVSGLSGEMTASSAARADLPAFVRLQLWINALFTSGMMAIGDGGAPGAMVTALLLSFAYGALHTLGPGHGKAVVVSYFAGAGGSLGRGVVMGLRIAVFHVLSAVLVVFLFDFALRQTTGAAPSDYRMIRLGSYALIVVIGAVLLWQALSMLRSDRAGPAHDHSHGHAGCAACGAAQVPRGGGWIAASVGIVPCTGALLVMLFGLANDLVVPAVLMVVAISAGMAVAMSLIGVAAIVGRDWAQGRFGGDSLTRDRFDLGARIAGAGCVLVIGIMLFTLTLSHGSQGAIAADRLAFQGQASSSDSR